MDHAALTGLAARIETDRAYDAGLTQVAFEAVGAHLPRLDQAMIRNGALGGTDAVLMVIDHGLPGWSVAINGTASEADGHWVCTLRRSADDADEALIGSGHGPLLSNVLIAALLRALVRRAEAVADSG
ncbi:MAG: hypothetical protein HLUCCA08_05690 [Rhodobacteraceae bacterium HLUCCA08]|nr:MAG: hypothetical protein HLUCCA08_05690 [Rhodobacteraceae bacterium HLUCCA08]